MKKIKQIAINSWILKLKFFLKNVVIRCIHNLIWIGLSENK